MSLHFERELERLRKQILELGTMVEESVQFAMESVERTDSILAAKVIERDGEIDHLEILIEEECLKILALHQPVAADLRFIIAVLKMNNDLERIGDLSASIARRSLLLQQQHDFVSPVQFARMTKVAREMLREAFDALINLDNHRACHVCERDNTVDSLDVESRATVVAELRKDPEHVEALLAIHGISRDLERIADLATNIAQDVTYMLEGEIVRHGHTSDENTLRAPGAE